jgi:hypothetical protein
MNLQRIEQGLSSMVAEASFIFRIENPTDHEKALDLMDQLIEDYAKHEPLIDLLCISIEKYENSAHQFLIFNQGSSQINSGIYTQATSKCAFQNNWGASMTECRPPYELLQRRSGVPQLFPLGGF